MIHSRNLNSVYIAMLRIHDISMWILIQIRGSRSLTNGSGAGSWIRILLFSSLTFKMLNRKLIYKKVILLLTFGRYICIIFQR
jgi:hypothetical protein